MGTRHRGTATIGSAALLPHDVDAGFERMVRDHAAAVRTLTRRICGPAGDDVTQDTFIRALRALRAMTPEERRNIVVRPWILTIARNTAYNHQRTASRRPRVTSAVPPDHPDGAPQPQTHVERSLTAARLEECIDSLPTAQRDAVVLRYVLDVSSRDAAEILGISENTLKSHLARALRNLNISFPDLRSLQ
jgi:RNA polymerase sigma factor (sigma-70 family)